MTRPSLLLIMLLTLAGQVHAEAPTEVGATADGVEAPAIIADGGNVDGGNVDGASGDGGGVDGGVVDGGVDGGVADGVVVVGAVDGGVDVGHIGAVDAGVAVAPPSPSPSPSPSAATSITVIVEDLPTPLAFTIPVPGRDARKRASEASAAFSAALAATAAEGVPPAQVVHRDGLAIVKIRGRAVATLSPADAEAAGAASLVAWGDELETRLVEFVRTYERRHSLQTLAFHVFFSVFLVVLAVLTLRGLNAALTRADAAVEGRAGSIKPLILFDVPLLSSDAVRGLLATGLLVGRVFSVVVVVFAAAGGVLAQFETTRPLLEKLVSAVVRPVVGGAETFVAAIPGLVLAVLLVVVLRAVLRFVRLLLDGVAAGRVTNGVIKPRRAPVARVVVTVLVVVVALPLIIGAAFGRFGTPFETLALGAGAVVLLGALPWIASGVIGIAFVWRGSVSPGDWVEVDGFAGEVSAIGLTEVQLVPAHGGTISIPMLLLVWKPLRRLSRQPELEQFVRLARREKASVLVETMCAIVHGIDKDGGAEIVEADAETALVRLHIPLGKSDARQALTRAVLAAVDDGVIALAPRQAGPTG